jgi:cytochrome c
MGVATASAAGDAHKGEALFVRCAVCHTAQAGASNRMGPNLFGVFGRKSGTLAGYSFSAPMIKAGIIWNDDTLTRYLRNPREVVPGTKMTFAGFSDPQQAGNVAAYLATLK